MVLTKTEKKRRARERYLKTKGYALKMAKRELKAKDKEWALNIRSIGSCLVCGSTNYLNAHHLIPREIKQFRHDPNNGVCLCITHHKFSRNISAHNSPAIFIAFLKARRPVQFNWLMSHVVGFLDKEEPDQDIKLGVI